MTESLTATRSSSAAQVVRFVAVGGLVAAVYIGLTLLLSGPVGVPIQVAIPIGYVTAVVLHFALQRNFVFRQTADFALTTRQQVRRYVLLGVVQYALTAAATTWLPGLLDVSEQVAYVATVTAISAVGFIVLRNRIFHPPSR